MNIPPITPIKKEEKRPNTNFDMVRKALFAQYVSSPEGLPPPAPMKKARKRPPSDFSNVIPFEFIPDQGLTPPTEMVWGVTPVLVEAQILAESGDVRDKYLLHSPEDIVNEDNIKWLEKLWELYCPTSQPCKENEEAYLKLMRNCIDCRLADLSD